MQVVPLKKEAYDLLHQGMIAFSDMQQAGVRIDVDYCKQAYKDVTKEIKNQERKVYDYPEIKEWKKIYKNKFNLDSYQQMSHVLFDVFEYEPLHFTDTINPKTGEPNPAVDKEALEALGLAFTDDFLRYKRFGKIKNTYLKNIILETCEGYLYPFLNLHTVRTFRSSANMPNIQNIPVRDKEMNNIIRRSFIPRKGNYLIEADYGGVEVKGASWNNHDPNLLEYLRNPLTADMHSDFMQLLFKLKGYNPKCAGEKTLRKGTKNGFTFPQFYGDYYGNNAVSLWNWANLKGKTVKKKQGLVLDSGITLGEHLIKNGIKNFDQFKKHVQKVEDNMWNKRFTVYRDWKEKQYALYTKQGYLTSLTGFVFQGVMSKNDAVNYPIQSVSFHCLLWSAIRLVKLIKKYKMKTKIVFQIHDSVIGDCPKNEKKDFYELLQQVMCHDIKKYWDFIITPLELEADCSELDGNWSKMKTEMTYIH